MRYKKDSSKSSGMAAGSCFPVPLLFRKKTFGFEKGKDLLGAFKKSSTSEKSRDTRRAKSSGVAGNTVEPPRQSSEVARKSSEVAAMPVARKSTELGRSVVARKSTEVAGNTLTRMSSGAGGNFGTMTELRAKIATFRDLLDLPPCVGSSSIVELMIVTVKDLNRLHPDVVQCISVSKAEGAPMHQVINFFCEALKSLGNHWVHNDEWMVKSKDAKIANSDLEEFAHAVLDDMINVARERMFDLMDTDDEEPVDSSASSSPPIGSYGKSFPDSFSGKQSLASSPKTPTSVLPQYLSSRSGKERAKVSCSPPLLLPLRVQAVEKLNPIDIKRLSFHMFPHAAQQLQLKNAEEAKRDSEVTGDDAMQVDNEGVNGVVKHRHMLSFEDFVRVKMEVLLPPSSLESIVAGENIHLVPAGAATPPPPSIEEVTTNSEASQSPSRTSSVVSEDNSPPQLPMASEDTISSTLAAGDSAESLPAVGHIPPPPPPQLPKATTAPLPPPPPPPPSMATSEKAATSPPPPPPPPAPPVATSNTATPPPPPPPMASGHVATTASPPPPPIPGKAGPPPPPPAPGSTPPPPPPPMNSSNGSVPAPPPPMQPGKGGAPPPPPTTFAGAARLRAKATKLKRSAQMGTLYRALKGKIEGSSGEGKSSQRKGGKGASSSGGNGKQSMADALAEMTKRSTYFQQIEEDVKNYATSIKEVKAALSSFQTTDMAELMKFHSYVESHLEKLTDETQVLARFEDFPGKKLEGLRMAAALYSKLDAMVVTLQNWKMESPACQLLDKVENYFNKIKGDLDTLDRTKDDELKKFKSQNIHFDFAILVRIKELLVDVSSNCMELALKEAAEAKANEKEGQSNGKKTSKVLWKAFQFAYRIYTFAGGQDDRADRLTREVAQEIQTDQPQK